MVFSPLSREYAQSSDFFYIQIKLTKLIICIWTYKYIFCTEAFFVCKETLCDFRIPQRGLHLRLPKNKPLRCYVSTNGGKLIQQLHFKSISNHVTNNSQVNRVLKFSFPFYSRYNSIWKNAALLEFFFFYDFVLLLLGFNLKRKVLSCKISLPRTVKKSFKDIITNTFIFYILLYHILHSFIHTISYFRLGLL